MTKAEIDILFATNGVGAISAADLRQFSGFVLDNLGSLKRVTENAKSGYRLANEDPLNHGDIGQNAVDLSTSDKAGEYYGATGDNSFASGYLTSAGGNYSVAEGYMTKSGSAFPDPVLNVLKQIDIPLDTRIATQYVTGVGYSSQVITLAAGETIYAGMATGPEPSANVSDSKIYVYDVTGGLDIQIDALTPIYSADNDYSGAGVYWSEAGAYTNNTGVSMDIQVVYSAYGANIEFTDVFVTPGADVWMYASKTLTAIGLNLPDTVVEYSPAYGLPKSTYDYTRASGVRTSAEAEGANAEGFETLAGGKYSHSEGFKTVTSKSSELILIPADGAIFDNFGSVHDSNDTKVVVGSDRNNNGTGAAYVYNLDGTGEIKIVGSDAVANDRFGSSVAINSTKILVGSPHNGATDLGAVYLYDLDGTNELKITPTIWTQQNLYFGMAVALTETKIIVAAPFDNQSGLNVSGAIYIYNLDGTGEIKVTAGTPIANSYFGYSVDATETHVIVGARTEGTKGAAYIFNIDGTGEIRLQPSEITAYDYFGESVAINSTKVLVGAIRRDYDGNANAGSAYIYNLDGTGETIIRPEANIASIFGMSVALTETKAIVGATGDHTSGTYSGAVYLYDLDGTNGFRVTPNGNFNNYFLGGSVSMNSTHLIAGTKTDNSIGELHIYELSNLYNGLYANSVGIGTIAQNGGMLAAGRYNVGTSGMTIVEVGIGGTDTTRLNAFEVYTDGTLAAPETDAINIVQRGPKALTTKEYVDNALLNITHPTSFSTSFTEMILKASDGLASDAYGQGVAINSTKIAIGASGDDDNGATSGTVYLYDRDGSNEIKIQPSDASAAARFGQAIAMTETKIIIGAPLEDTGLTNSGAVYIYNLDGTGEIKIKASDAKAEAFFGDRISADATSILIGAPGDSTNGFGSGAAYLYNIDGTGEIKILPSNGAASYGFGSVSLTTSKIIVGAPGANTNKGAVYTYDRDGTNENIITASDGVTGANFGLAIDANDYKIVVGADSDNAIATDAGAVYIYNIDGSGEFKITASDASQNGFFGTEVSLDGARIVVGSYLGKIYSYNLDGTNEHQLSASDGSASNYFGIDRSIQILGNKILIGASTQLVNAISTGAAYLYTIPDVVYESDKMHYKVLKETINVATNLDFKVDGQLIAPNLQDIDIISGQSLVTKSYTDSSITGLRTSLNTPSTVDGTFRNRIVNPTPVDYDMFGDIIAARGDLLVAGVPFDTNTTSKGVVYLYNTDGTLLNTLLDPDLALNPTWGAFGSVVALNSTLMAIGNSRATRNGQTMCGTLWIMDHSGNIVNEIYPPDVNSSTNFAASVAMNENYIVAGDTGNNIVFIYDLNGNELARCTPPEAVTAYAQSIAINDTQIFVASYNDNKVYEYNYSGTYIKTWTGSDTVAGDGFGDSIAVSNTKVVIGATGVDGASGSGTGAAYIYNTDGTGEVKVTVPTADAANTFAYGYSASIDGDRILIGSPWSNDTQLEAGVAYLYDLNGNLIQRMVSYEQYFLSDYGGRVIVTPKYLIIAATGDPGTYAGNVYIYDRGVANEVYGASTVGGLTPAELIAGLIKSDVTQAGAGSIAINNIVKISQVDYDALGTPDINTFYIII